MTQNVSKHYGQLKPIERFRLVLAASARDDDADIDRLKASGARVHLVASDDCPYQRSFISLAHWIFIDLVEEAAGYRELLDYASFRADLRKGTNADKVGEEAAADDDDPFGEPWRRVMFQGYVFRTRYLGWVRFCKGLGVEPFSLWKDYPGFLRLQGTFKCSKRMAYVRAGFARVVLGRQEITADELARCPLTPKKVAKELKWMFREMVGGEEHNGLEPRIKTTQPWVSHT